MTKLIYEATCLASNIPGSYGFECVDRFRHVDFLWTRRLETGACCDLLNERKKQKNKTTRILFNAPKQSEFTFLAAIKGRIITLLVKRRKPV